jgi:hypothetical protein
MDEMFAARRLFITEARFSISNPQCRYRSIAKVKEVDHRFRAHRRDYRDVPATSELTFELDGALASAKWKPG